MEEILTKFSAWTPWADRFSLPLDLPGVYMLAEFRSAPLVKAALSSTLIYIGETCGQSLHGRLYQFNRSGFHGKPGHSGGTTFAHTFKSNPDPAWLFISVMSVALQEPQASAFIRHVERALLWEYVQQHGAYPVCNRK
ncbi:MAG: hypothetical protein FWF20_11875 [Betaproteobacteria bacterium]|nr:hypothetical protein [Betaproteobacteria bacterium]MCL2887446.1 hypothetical protein [Betaproteobacteria bacterium]